MKAIAVAAAALTLLSAPAVQAQDAQAEIGEVLDQLNVASTAADTTAYFALFTPDARFIGTDATERWSLAEFRAYTEPYFAQGRGWTYTPRDRVITIAPIDCRCLAWFDEVLDNASYGVTRGSGVLRLTEDGWKIEQYVLSFTIPNDKARAVVEVVGGEN
ncbi:nuclear transport factor 2 family protein [Brevundimonas sp. M20]|uniref:nuclear transport factor 2 family protein n=1 Tax=Brevundimonas sp. M20 TaxID=2591463 RepID=UPI001147685C|nr:nuclear transport factor 2 family protein [Brevundimonas sp. M20]QDH73299.1 nuclear transport factor 2 family protein [Brevundimonas sp. M20]